jgi:hypothetical protein
MKSWQLAVGVVLVCLLLGYRVFAAERRLDRLQARLDGRLAGGAADSDPARRIAELEHGVARLSEGLAGIARQADSKLGPADIEDKVSEERILSVVTSEQQRMLERHLAFHRDRWIEQRDQALAAFVERFGLSPLQHQRIRGLLLSEIDGMAELFKGEQAKEQPDQFVSDAARLLLDTDRRVEAMLEAEALSVWKQTRFAERRILWPWLPEPLQP